MKEDFCYIDFETRSKADLTLIGAVNYSKHESTQVIVASFAINNEKPRSVFWPKSIKDFPADIRNFKGKFIAHYIAFENSIFENVLKAPDKFCNPKNYIDTMALCYRWGLPGGLDNAAIALDLGHKIEAGKGLIQKYSKPDRKTGEFLEIPKKDLNDFRLYCEGDIALSRKIHKKLPNMDSKERRLWELDQEMNREGIEIDKKSFESLYKSYNYYFSLAEKEAEKLAGRQKGPSKNKLGTLTLSSNPGIIRYFGENGTFLPNAQAPTLEKLLESKLPPKLKKAIQLRFSLTAKAPTKLEAIKNLHTDYFLKYHLQYYGGHTGRWAGRGVQTHNFYRDVFSDAEYKKQIERLAKHQVPLEEAIEIISKLMRGLLYPGKGHKFLIGDLSAIEARVAFWIAGCKLGLNEFRTSDIKGKAFDIYTKFAAELPLEKIQEATSEKTKDTKRQVGKKGILGLQYGMGATKFSATLEKDRLPHDLEMCAFTVRRYRNKYKEIPEAWREIERAFKQAMRTGKAQFRDLKFVRTENAILIHLPSGREISYWKPKLIKMEKFGEIIEVITYIHGNMGRVDTWGGTLFENIVQAVARDFIRDMFFECDKKLKGKIKMTEHDSITVKTPAVGVKKEFEIFSSIMSTVPEWAKGIPLKAECFIAERFGK